MQQLGFWYLAHMDVDGDGCTAIERIVTDAMTQVGDKQVLRLPSKWEN